MLSISIEAFFSIIYSKTSFLLWTDDKKKWVGVLFMLWLYLSLAQNWPERLSTALKKTNCEFCSLSTFVLLPSHLPSLLWFTDFLLTIRTLNHSFHFSNSTSDKNKTFSIEDNKPLDESLADRRFLYKLLIQNPKQQQKPKQNL